MTMMTVTVVVTMNLTTMMIYDEDGDNGDERDGDDGDDDSDGQVRLRKMDMPSLVGGQVINTRAVPPPHPLSLSLSLILATRHTLCHRPVCHRGRGAGC